MRRWQYPPVGVVVIAASVALALAGCSGFERKRPPETKAAPQAVRVYYAGRAGVKVYQEPSASSKVVGVLSRHEEVTRSKLERGYAYVESARSGVQGWVDNAELIWRLPSAPAAAAPVPAETPPAESAAPADEEDVEAPAAPEPPAPRRDAAPTSTTLPAAPPRAKKSPGGASPSVLDAY